MASEPFIVEKPLDILLVHLPFYDWYHYQTPQLGLLYVATSLKEAGFKVGVLDDAELDAHSFVDYIKGCLPQILGFHVTTDSLPRVCRTIEILRKQNIEPPLIILGGPHVTIDDQSLLSRGFGSIVVRGEGEETAVEIARWWLCGIGQLETIPGITYRTPGGIVRNPDREYITNLNILPELDRGLLLKKPRFKTFQIISGRGCPFHCAFCAEGLTSIRYRFRSPESVLREIHHLIGDLPRVYLGILDDTFLVDRHRVETMAKALIKEFGVDNRIVWFCEGRADFVSRNKDLFPLLREAGLVRIQIGVESGSQKVLDLYRKGIKVAEIEAAVATLRDADIPSIYGNFIIGGAVETSETMQQSIDLAKRLIASAPGRMECAASMLGLYPGTAISKGPSQFGLRIIDPQMLRCLSLQHPVAVTEKMGVNDILTAYDEFSREVLQAYEATVPSIPFPLIRRHIDLQAYGVTTRWCEMFMGYPCIKSYHEMLNRKGYRSIRAIEKTDLLSMVPYRTARVLDVEDDQIAVKSHPRKILFNEMATKIYEFCSGKQTVEEIIRLLRQGLDTTPPEPFLTEQVIAVLRKMDDQFLVVFSDL